MLPMALPHLSSAAGDSTDARSIPAIGPTNAPDPSVCATAPTAHSPTGCLLASAAPAGLPSSSISAGSGARGRAHTYASGCFPEARGDDRGDVWLMSGARWPAVRLIRTGHHSALRLRPCGEGAGSEIGTATGEALHDLHTGERSTRALPQLQVEVEGVSIAGDHGDRYRRRQILLESCRVATTRVRRRARRVRGAGRGRANLRPAPGRSGRRLALIAASVFQRLPRYADRGVTCAAINGRYQHGSISVTERRRASLEVRSQRDRRCGPGTASVHHLRRRLRTGSMPEGGTPPSPPSIPKRRVALTLSTLFVFQTPRAQQATPRACRNEW